MADKMADGRPYVLEIRVFMLCMYQLRFVVLRLSYCMGQLLYVFMFLR